MLLRERSAVVPEARGRGATLALGSRRAVIVG
jgi:hypothetical protein